MRKPRIFYLITRSEPGGAQSHVLELLRGFRDDYDVILGTGEKGYLMNEAEKLGIPVHFIPTLGRSISPLNDYRAYRSIVQLFDQLKPDLVHCHSSKAGILGRLAAHRLGIKSIFTAHGWAFAEGTPWSRKLIAILPERLLSRWTNLIITVSETDRLLALGYGVGSAEKMVTIHNGISDTNTEEANPGKQPVILIMVARFAPPKDFNLLLEAAGAINAEFRLCLVGDGPMLESSRVRAAELGIQNKVEFTGSRSDVELLLQKSGIFVLASNWEGLPISILEAMRAGLPVVCSRVGGIHEAVADGISGTLVPRGDINALSAALEELIGNPDRRIKMGHAARARYEQSFTTEIMLANTARQYTKLGLSVN